MREAGDGEAVAGQRFEIVQLLEMAVADVAARLVAFPDDRGIAVLGPLLRCEIERRIPAPGVGAGQPDVPSFAELGARPRQFQLTGFQCCVVPAGTPPEIIQKLSKLLVAGGKSEKIQQLMKSFGVDDTAMTFEETQRLFKEEAPVWLEAVASLGLAPS